MSLANYANNFQIEFLEVSHLSFVKGLGYKGKEGMMQKRTGSTQPGQAGCNCFGLIRSTFCMRCRHFCCNECFCTRWVERWFFIKVLIYKTYCNCSKIICYLQDTCFGYINPKDGRVKSVILFDQGFEVSTGLYSMGLQTGFHTLTLSRQVAFKCWTRRRVKEWVAALKETASTTGKFIVLITMLIP